MYDASLAFLHVNMYFIEIKLLINRFIELGLIELIVPMSINRMKLVDESFICC
jgi:hypothetical protein